jgi:hypothetical protein
MPFGQQKNIKTLAFEKNDIFTETWQQILKIVVIRLTLEMRKVRAVSLSKFCTQLGSFK